MPNFGSKFNIWCWGKYFFLIAQLFVFDKGFSLACRDVNHMTRFFLRAHYSIHEFNQEISERTVQNFIKRWDPGKVYFLKKDIDKFTTNAYSNIPKMIQKSDCSLIDVLFSLYSKRFKERKKLITELIVKKHDFKKDEFLTINRKKMSYAIDEKEIRERWRKRIKFQHLQLKKTINDENKIRKKLSKRYQLVFKKHQDLTTEDVYGAFMDAFANALDPHTDYYSPSELEEFRISTRLSLEGIGALLRSEDGVTSIQSLVPGGAAQKTGKVKVGDKIVAVGQAKGTPVDVIDMDLKDVVSYIRGPGGSEVRLYLKRAEKELVVPIIREKIQLADREAKSDVFSASVEVSKSKKKIYKIGVIELPSFYMDFEGRQANKENFKSSSRDMEAEIQKLKKLKVDAIVVDLRSNGGGSLDESINVAGLFVGKGPVVQIKGAQTKPYVSSYDRKKIYSGPLVVMIDKQSASASEIFAGAIKDYHRGIIVGDSHTFGKGTVQNLNDLDRRLGAVKVTISKFYRPSGKSTQLRGVASDIIFPSITDAYEIGEKFYDFPIQWEKVKAAKFDQFNLVDSSLDVVRSASNKRIKKNKDFLEIRKIINKFQKEKEDRLKVSLKLEEKKNKEDNEDEKDAADPYGDLKSNFKNDIYMQETVKIATDYARNLKKQKLLNIKLLDLKEQSSKKAKKK